jgi:hypothetical protein
MAQISFGLVPGFSSRQFFGFDFQPEPVGRPAAGAEERHDAGSRRLIRRSD